MFRDGFPFALYKKRFNPSNQSKPTQAEAFALLSGCGLAHTIFFVAFLGVSLSIGVITFREIGSLADSEVSWERARVAA